MSAWAAVILMFAVIACVAVLISDRFWGKR